MRENFWLGITTFIEENQPITDSVIIVIIVIENLLILSLTYLILILGGASADASGDRSAGK